MSRELEELLAPTPQIPWEEAASFLVAVKDVTKVAGRKEEDEGEVAKFLQKGKGMKAKKAEMEKRSSVNRVRELWKLAQGEGEPITEPEEGFAGVAPGSAPVEPAAIEAAGAPRAVAQGKPGKLMPPQTPEHRRMQETMAMLEQEQLADQAAQMNEADHYRQVAEEASAEAQELGAQLQETQAQLDQTSQQAQMSQMQADQATQQAQQQAQSDAMEKQQLSDESLSARQNIMQMRQAMQSYRENLQQIALQDPTAAAGPSPEEQGQGPTPGELQSMMADQQMAKEDQAMAEGKPVPTSGAPEEGGPPPGSPEDMAALEQEAAAEAEQEAAAPKKPPAKKEKKDEGSAPKVEVNVEKKSSAIPELLRADSFPFEKAATSWKERAIGAAVGAPLFAGIQSASDLKRGGGESSKEKALRMKLEELQSKENPGALHKHKTNITRALYETAKTNREHPQSAAIMAGLTGAGLGATLGPDVGRSIKGIFQRVARR